MQENEIKILLNIKKELFNIVEKKTQLLTELNLEIQILSKQIELIDNLISAGSFISASNLLDAEVAANKPQSDFNNLNYTEKIFSPTEELLVVLQFEDNSIQIRFTNPEISQISQEKYIDQFVKPCLMKLKKIELKLNPIVLKEKFGTNEYIVKIQLKNVEKFESFEFVVENVRKLLQL